MKEELKAKNNATLRSTNAQLSFPVARVALVFCVLALSFHLLMWLIPDNGVVFIQRMTASSCAFLLNITGLTVRLNGTSMALPNALWTVTPECTAISAVFVFLSFVFAYPAKMKSKALAALVGVPFLFAANVMRLFGLGWATCFNRDMAGYFHDYIWQVAFLVLVASMWIVWLERVVSREGNAEVRA